jgi:hypothetical protein
MSPTRQVQRGAQAVLAEELAGDAETSVAVVDAFRTVLGKIAARLGPWVGRDGCVTLMQRGIERARADHPALARAKLDPADFNIHGLERLTDLDPAAARAASEAVLGYIIEHLGRLVGLDVALRLITPKPPASWSIDADVDDGDSK